MFDIKKEPVSDEVNVSMLTLVKNEPSIIKKELSCSDAENSSSSDHWTYDCPITNVKAEALKEAPLSDDEDSVAPGCSSYTDAVTKQELEIELQPQENHYTLQKPDPDVHKQQRKKSRATARQLEEIVKLMLENQDLALGKFTGPMAQEKNERMWDNVAAKISSFGPPKTGLQCKTTWRDLRLKVKGKNANMKRSRNNTAGNVAKVPELTDLDKKVLQIIGTESSEGVGAEESGLEEQINVGVPTAPAAAAAHSSLHVQQYENEMDTATEPTQFVDEVEATPPLPSAVPIKLRSCTTAQRQSAADSTGSRKRPFVELDDVAKQYAELQANKNAILSDIAVMLRDVIENKKKTDCEKNALIKERNDIEREKLSIEKEKLRIKSLRLQMMMKNQHVADGSELNDK